MKIGLKQLFQCLIILLRTSTDPPHHLFWVYFTIIISLIMHPQSVFYCVNQKSKNRFLSDYLAHQVIMKSPYGFFFIARPRFEDLARFLFSEKVAKWEPLSVLRPKKEEIVIDIGANTGYYTLRLSSQVGKKGKIIAIEADPTSCNILKKNCELNNISNVEIINLAISDSNMKVVLHQNKTHSGISSISTKDYYKPTTNDLLIQATTLDNLLKNRFQKINWIKIDVEGAELAVLRGSTNTLKNTKNILIEIHEHILRQNNEDYNDILKILKENGFKLRLFNEFWDSNDSPNQGLKSDYILGQKNLESNLQ